MSQGVTRSELQERLWARGFAPAKSLGQHFLIDQNIASSIAQEASRRYHAQAIEIGPGAGALTVFLAEEFGRVLAIEADRRLAASLEEVLGARGIGNVEVVVEDALGFAFERPGLPLVPTVCVGNLPYNISSQLILRVLERAWYVEDMVVMVQAEMADRLLARPGSRASSALSVRVGLLAEPRLVRSVPASVFVPPPKVASKVVHLARMRDPISVTEPEVYASTLVAIRAAFQRRRQMLRRVFTKEQCVALEARGIDPSRRPESLVLEEWVSVGRALEAVNG